MRLPIRLCIVVSLGALSAAGSRARCQPPAPAPATPAVAWGTIDPLPAATGRTLFRVAVPPVSGRLDLPAGFPQISAARAPTPDGMVDLPVEVSADGSRVEVLAGAAVTGPLTIETLEGSAQFADGRIGLSALDAKVNGSRAKLESHPGNHRIGFWTDPADSVAWTFTATRWGRYEVRLTYSNAGPPGAGVEVDVAGRRLAGRLASTGSWYRYVTLSLGSVLVERAGELPVRVRCTEPVGGAFMDLKAVVLMPACEGDPPVQGDDGVVLLHARDATVRGTMLRWEPAEKKQTLGYWVRPGDAAEWEFTVARPGTFTVEVLQGCGPGQGGREMGLSLDPGSLSAAEVTFVVEETGGFQDFRAREVGRMTIPSAGPHLLRVQPRAIARQAACDIRQVRLVPLEP